jgi:hypothetical protein
MASIPRDVLDLLIWWLNGVHTGENKPPLTLSSHSIAMPEQFDQFSCGIIVLSTMAWILLNFSPWTQTQYACERIEWFLRLAKNLHIRNVSAHLLSVDLSFIYSISDLDEWFDGTNSGNDSSGEATYDGDSRHTKESSGINSST